MALQILILATGNYTFFNILTIALAAWLFIEPERARRGWAHRAVSIAVAALIGVASVMISLGQLSIPLPPGGAEVVHAVAPFDIVNSYGLFAVMTTTRPEIVVEGSNDGADWQAYEFPYKPGDLRRAPPVVEPGQPRLDWQMWFAALGQLPGEPVVPELHAAVVAGRAGRFAAAGAQPLSERAAEVRAGAAVHLSLHEVGLAGLVDARRTRLVFSGGKFTVEELSARAGGPWPDSSKRNPMAPV